MKRLYFSIVLVVISSMVALGWVLDKVFESTATEQIESELKLYLQISKGLQSQLAATDGPEQQQQLARLAENFSFALSLEPRDNLALPAQLLSKLNQGEGILLDSPTGSYILQAIEDSDWVLRLQLPVSKSTQDRRLELILTLSLYLGVCVALAVWLLPLTRRLSLLNETAELFGKGHLQKRIPKSHFSYISDLENSFNQMASQVDELLTENKLLADSLSHDLRTPLACLRFGMDAMQSTQDPEKIEGYLERMEAEITHVEKMIGAYLDYAKIERCRYQLDKQPVYISNLLDDLNKQLEPLLIQQNKQFTINLADESIQFKVDGHWIYRGLLNLLTNAISHAQTSVRVSGFKQVGRVVLLVEDDGEGIPADKIDEIFKPFVRLQKNRSRNNSGFGLGLAIVNKVIEWHSGTIKVSESESLGGACFKLTIPLNN